jgi:hypothetical protein
LKDAHGIIPGTALLPKISLFDGGKDKALTVQADIHDQDIRIRSYWS